MTMAKKLSLFQIKRKWTEINNKLDFDSIGTIKVLNQRLSELSFEELRFLLSRYNCELQDLLDRIWAINCLGKSKTKKVIR